MPHVNTAATSNWLDLLRRRDGDGDLGRGLVRLAELAATVHQREAARLNPSSTTEAAERTDGPVHGPNRRDPHTEVRR